MQSGHWPKADRGLNDFSAWGNCSCGNVLGTSSGIVGCPHYIKPERLWKTYERFAILAASSFCFCLELPPVRHGLKYKKTLESISAVWARVSVAWILSNTRVGGGFLRGAWSAWCYIRPRLGTDLSWLLPLGVCPNGFVVATGPMQKKKRRKARSVCTFGDAPGLEADRNPGAWASFCSRIRTRYGSCMELHRGAWAKRGTLARASSKARPLSARKDETLEGLGAEGLRVPKPRAWLASK